MRLDRASVRVDIDLLTASPQLESEAEQLLAELTRITANPFLDDLRSASLGAFDDWRATVQLDLDERLDQLLQHVIEASMGSSTAVRLAELRVQLSPHAESAWYHLIESLRQISDLTRARQLLDQARDRLAKGGFVHTGLIARVSANLQQPSSAEALTAAESSEVVLDRRVRVSADVQSKDPTRATLTGALTQALGWDKRFQLIDSARSAEADCLVTCDHRASEHSHTVSLSIRETAAKPRC